MLGPSGRGFFDVLEPSERLRPTRLCLMESEYQFLIVADAEDLLAESVLRSLSERSRRVRRISPADSGSLSLTLDTERYVVDNQIVAGLFLATSPSSCFSEGYELEDQAFCDSEMSSIWLAAANLPSVYTINRYDAMSWYDGLRWPVWLLKLHRAGFSCVNLAIGNVPDSSSARWRPYIATGSLQSPERRIRSMMGSAVADCDDRGKRMLLFGTKAADVSEAQVLKTFATEQGIGLAEVILDAQGRIWEFDPCPSICDPLIAGSVAEHIANEYEDHLRRRRFN